MCGYCQRLYRPTIQGALGIKSNRLVQSFPFRSSFREVFLDDHHGDQLIDITLAVMFHHAADELSDAFFQLFEDGRDGILNLDNVFESGLVARNVTKEVGIYLRAVQGVSESARQEGTDHAVRLLLRHLAEHRPATKATQCRQARRAR